MNASNDRVEWPMVKIKGGVLLLRLMPPAPIQPHAWVEDGSTRIPRKASSIRLIDRCPHSQATAQKQFSFWVGHRRDDVRAKPADFFHSDSVAGVAPTVPRVGQHVGDLFIREIA